MTWFKSITNYLAPRNNRFTKMIRTIGYMLKDVIVWVIAIGIVVGIPGGLLYASFVYPATVLMVFLWIMGIVVAVVAAVFLFVGLHDWWQSAAQRVYNKDRERAEAAKPKDSTDVSINH